LTLGFPVDVFVFTL